MEKLGGLSAYQNASLRGGSLQKGWGAAGKWLVAALTRRGILGTIKTKETRKNDLGDGITEKESQNDVLDINATGVDVFLHKKQSPVKLTRMLDVGAIDGLVYNQFKFMQVVSIDLNSKSPKVMQQDFFERPLPSNDSELFEIVGLSLVLNFLGDAKSRGYVFLIPGRMIMRTKLFLVPRGILYIVLPLPCITNSRYLTHYRMVEIMLQMGFVIIEKHFSAKLAYYVFRMDSNCETVQGIVKIEVNFGVKRNNFAIIV